MKALAVGARIWLKTVFLNAVFFGIGGLLRDSWEALGIAFFVFLLGFLFTLPLLLIIIPLVDLSVKIPYSIHARIAWLTFCLMLIVIGFYLVVGVDDWLMGTTIAALLVAVLTTCTSLIKLNKQQDEVAQLHNVLKIINT